MTSCTVIGAGAVGLLYGARLATAGVDVRWVLGAAAPDVARSGITVSSRDGDVHLPPGSFRAYAAPADAPPADLVLVALKTTANGSLASLVGPACAPGATVAMFQNGLGVEDQLRAAVPQAGPVLGALCFVCAHRRAPGVAEHLDYGRVTLGEAGARTVTPAVSALAADLRAGGVEVLEASDLVEARWRKLVWNIPFNGLSVLLDASSDELVASPVTRPLVEALMREVLAGAAAVGAPIEHAFVDRMIAETEAMTPYEPSMKLDHDAGRPLEVAAIYDAPVAAAAAAGVSLPRVATLATLLRAISTRPVGDAPGGASG